MKFFAALMALSLTWVSLGEPPAPPAAGQLAPVTITAPGPKRERAKELEAARAVGGAAALSGLGVMTYAVFFASAGPVGWAAGLLFAGGLTAYLAHRALRGQDDFGPAARARPNPTPPSR